MENKLEIISHDEALIKHRSIYSQDLLWPLLAYNITVPVFGESELNPLETVVYQLIENKEHQLNNISQLTGLNIELIEFIVSRMIQLEVIDARMNILQSREDLSMNEHSKKYIAATVYYDIFCESFLPIIHKGGQTTTTANSQDLFCKFNSGSSGKSQKIKARVVTNKVSANPDIDPQKVIEIIRRYRKELKRKQLLNDKHQQSHNIPIENIRIDKEPKVIHVHRKAFIKKNDDTVFVSNGFDGEIDSLASKTIKTKMEWLCKKIKEKADTEAFHDEEDLPFYCESTILYISSLIESSHKNIATLYKNKINCRSDQDMMTAEQKIFFKNIYSVIEHFLATITLEFPEKTPLLYIQSSDPIQNGQTLQTLAEDIGFDTSKLAKKFFTVSKGSIKHIDYNDPAMSPVMALTLSSAKQNPLHPFHQLAEQHPGFFIQCQELKHIRNAASHGDTSENLATSAEVENWNEWFTSISKILTSSLTLEPDNTAAAEELDNITLKISRGIDEIFTNQQQESLPVDIKNTLKDAIRAGLNQNITEMVTHSASMLQKGFYHASKTLDSNNESNNNNRHTNNKVYFESINESISLKTIPENLSKTNPSRIYSALQGIDSTLGANLVAFLYRVHPKDFHDMPTKNLILHTVSKLIKLRGHSRIITSTDISINDAKKLQKASFDILTDLTAHFAE